VKITKQRLEEIIKEEVNNLNNEEKGIKGFISKMKGSKDKGKKVSRDVQTTFDYFMRLVNSPTEVKEFMNLLDDAIRASTETGTLGSENNVRNAIVDFVKQVAPKVSVTISQIDLTPDEEPTKPAAKKKRSLASDRALAARMSSERGPGSSEYGDNRMYEENKD
jgi:hypothetical protein